MSQFDDPRLFKDGDTLRARSERLLGRVADVVNGPLPSEPQRLLTRAVGGPRVVLNDSVDSRQMADDFANALRLGLRSSGPDFRAFLTLALAEAKLTKALGAAIEVFLDRIDERARSVRSAYMALSGLWPDEWDTERLGIRSGPGDEPLLAFAALFHTVWLPSCLVTVPEPRPLLFPPKSVGEIVSITRNTTPTFDDRVHIRRSTEKLISAVHSQYLDGAWKQTPAVELDVHEILGNLRRELNPKIDRDFLIPVVNAYALLLARRLSDLVPDSGAKSALIDMVQVATTVESRPNGAVEEIIRVAEDLVPSLQAQAPEGTEQADWDDLVNAVNGDPKTFVAEVLGWATPSGTELSFQLHRWRQRAIASAQPGGALGFDADSKTSIFVGVSLFTAAGATLSLVAGADPAVVKETAAVAGIFGAPAGVVTNFLVSWLQRVARPASSVMVEDDAE